MTLMNFKRGCALAVSAVLLAACGTQVSRAPGVSAVRPAEVAHLKAGVAPLVDRSPGTMIKIAGPNGLVVTRFLSGHQQVMVARRNQDGSIHTACVDNLQALDTALTAPTPTGTTRTWEAK